MQKNVSLFLGGIIILIGIAALAGNLFLFNLDTWNISWQIWPLIVVGLGLLFAVMPLVSPRQRGLGVFFIPATIILTNGVILTYTSILNRWGDWAMLWPFEVLGVAAGFLLAAVYTGLIGLYVPTLIVGLTGLVLAFCNTTGHWETWSWLWAVEPLAVGLSLLVLNLRAHSKALLVTGLCFCGFAGFVLASGFSFFLAGWSVFKMIGPLALICLGALLLYGSFARRPADPETPSTPSTPSIES